MRPTSYSKTLLLGRHCISIRLEAEEMMRFSETVRSSAMKLFTVSLAGLLALAPAVSPVAYGQSASSAQAYFGSTQNGVTVADMFAPTKLFSGQLKTSNVGSIL